MEIFMIFHPLSSFPPFLPPLYSQFCSSHLLAWIVLSSQLIFYYAELFSNCYVLPFQTSTLQTNESLRLRPRTKNLAISWTHLPQRGVELNITTVLLIASIRNIFKVVTDERCERMIPPHFPGYLSLTPIGLISTRFHFHTLSPKTGPFLLRTLRMLKKIHIHDPQA